MAESRQLSTRQQLSAGMEHMRLVVTEPAVEVSNSHVDDAGAGTTAEEGNDTYGVPGHIQPKRMPRTDAASNLQKRTDPFQFGSRFLEEGDDIFTYNAWDHVEVDDEYERFAQEQFQKQREAPVSDANKAKYNAQPERWWNKFYTHNTSNFFKDRKWLFQEFPILKDISSADANPAVVVEVGAGAGNTAFPIMAQNLNPKLTLHACDFSQTAIDVIKTSPKFALSQAIGELQACVWDIACAADAETGASRLPEGVEPGSVDVVILIFIFSALEPLQWGRALRNVWAMLKPGGKVLFRDYGRGDSAQVRFKKERWLDENFYARGDGTRVYFFEQEELQALWKGEQFEVLDFGVDRRMLVNRQRRLKMFRCWIQAKFQKPGD